MNKKYGISIDINGNGKYNVKEIGVFESQKDIDSFVKMQKEIFEKTSNDFDPGLSLTSKEISIVKSYLLITTEQYKDTIKYTPKKVIDNINQYSENIQLYEIH